MLTASVESVMLGRNFVSFQLARQTLGREKSRKDSPCAARIATMSARS
jgi:hypothetical protein